MNGMVKLFGFILAFSIAAFAMPAMAGGSDGHGNTFRLVMAPASTSGMPTQVTATITNTDCDRIRSFKIYVPAGVTVTAATAPGVAASNISIAAGVVSVKNVSLSGNQSITVTLTVTFSSGSICGPTTYKWGANGWENANWTGDKSVPDGSSKLNTSVSGVCNYSLSVTPNSAARGATTGMNATIANPSGSTSPITAVNLTAPAGFSIAAATPSSGTIATVLPANSIAVSGLSIAPGASLSVALQVSVPCNAAATGNNWSSTAGAGFAPTGPTQSTAITGACTLSISAPTSAAVNAPFAVSVALAGGPGTAPVTLAGSGCGSFTAGPVNAVGGTATFSSVTFTTAGAACTLTATAPDYTNGTKTLTTFVAGNLACGDPNNPTSLSTFNGSAAPSLTINDPGFALGVRGQNIVKPGQPECANVNWTFTNNVLGTGTTLDAKGNTIPANGVSFVWDQTLQPNAAYTYTVTWMPEWFGIASSSNRKTQFCAGAAPNACASVVNAQACTSPALLPSSIPGTDPACVSAEVWAVVSSGQCSGLPAPAADQTACVIVTSTIIDIKDPPIIRN